MAVSAQWMSSITTINGAERAIQAKKASHALRISVLTAGGGRSANGESGSSRPIVQAIAGTANSSSGAVVASARTLPSATSGESVSSTPRSAFAISISGQNVTPSP